MTGQKFSRLTAIKYMGHSKWECECECGKHIICNLTDLRKGHTKSCGCYRKDRMTGQRVFKDITGIKYGRLTVIGFSKRIDNKNYWLCKCDCGKEHIAEQNNLINGGIKSCGCLREEQLKKHGMSDTRIYKIWQNMVSRCYINSSTNYDDYGMRGISVCDEWKNSPENFIEWGMNNGYKDGLTIDRIDANGNYEPSNCRWATYKQQANNKRNTKKYFLNGEYKTIPELCNYYQKNYDLVRGRVSKGWDIERALFEEVHIEKRNKKCKMMQKIQ